jgi:hypothetical protein
MSEVKSYLVGVFDDDDVLLKAIPALREKGAKILEAFTPFPVHGIDPALGIKRSRLPQAAFIFGATGTTCALTLQISTLGFDWPMNIGGKPQLAFPSFIPVSFELTVLFAALGMVGTFLLASGLGPGSQKTVFDPRSSDDKFILVFDLEKNKGFTPEQLTEMIKASGASEVNQKDIVEKH